jgi:hypothetical protein
MMVFNPQEASVQSLLLDELAAARVNELLRQASRERLALSVLHPSPSPVARVARRSLHALGFLLMGAGLRLATAADRNGAAGRSVV